MDAHIRAFINRREEGKTANSPPVEGCPQGGVGSANVGRGLAPAAAHGPKGKKHTANKKKRVKRK